MVEPIKPVLREALKSENPELTDEMIDRLEELTHQRFQIDPMADPEALKQIDAERMEILQKHAPNYEAAAKKVAESEK